MNPPKLGEDRSRIDNIAKMQHELAVREVAQLQTLARLGDSSAMRCIGLMLLTGTVIGPDVEGAIGWFYEAATRGDAFSMAILGCAFEQGVGVERDLKLADFWQARAAARGAFAVCR
jgi:TPR repeat protein